MASVATKIVDEVARMTTLAASLYAQRLLAKEEETAGTKESAYHSLKRRYGLTRAQVRHLKDGRAKTVDAGLLARLRAAYIDSCERQLTKLQHEIACERAIGRDDALDDIEAATAALVAKVSQARARAKRARG